MNFSSICEVKDAIFCEKVVSIHGGIIQRKTDGRRFLGIPRSQGHLGEKDMQRSWCRAGKIAANG
jgi:hypothetical protein